MSEMKIKLLSDIKELCFKVSPSEAKVKEVQETVKAMIEKQNEIIMKLASVEIGEQIKDVTKEI